MYEILGSSGKLGTLTVKNRSVMTAASCSLSEVDGKMTEDMMAYYERRAKGGVGLIITEMVCVDEETGILFEKELTATKDAHIEEFRKLADRIHPYGTKMFAQLFHPGINGDPKLNPKGLISASASSGKKHGAAREVSREEIYALAEAFGQAALRVKKGGFDGVEIHGAHNYLIQSFLSPVSNRRDDEFGGSLENRTRFLRLIMEAIRRYCGDDFPIMPRISIEEYIGKDGYHADTGIKICQMLERWGADAINVTASGTSSKLSQSMEPITYPQGWRKHLMRAVKRSVSIPVCGVSVIRDPAYAEKLLREGYTDFVGSVRTFLADPDWMRKAQSGQEEDIVRCISCMACLEMHYKLGRITCALNPETGYEAQIKPLSVDGNGRLVLVLGAGPAGMQAAITAAARGFQVKVFEKARKAGGDVRLGSEMPRKEKLAWLIESLLHRCEKAGVSIVYGKAPSLAEIEAENPYAILDATGGVATLPEGIEGVQDNPMVTVPKEIILKQVDPYEESIVVVGSGMTGLETAEILSAYERNNAVVVMEAANRIAPGNLGSNRNVVTAVLDIQNVVFMLSRRLTKIGADRIYFCDSKTGEEYEYPCDRVVLALGVHADRPYGDRLESVCDRVIQVGDAKSPGKIWDAIHDGYHAAINL